MKTVGILVVCALLLSGCSSLIIRDDDTAMVITGKVAARTVNCVLTIWMLCASEWLAMDGAKRQEAFNSWWQQASPEERAAYQREQQARAAIILPLLQNQMYLNELQRHNMETERLQRQQINQQRQLHCSTRYAGSQAYTDCY